MKLYQLLSKFSSSASTHPVAIIDREAPIEFPDDKRLKELSNRDASPLSMRDVESFSVLYGALQIRLKQART